MLSISFEVDVPTGKVGGNLFFKCRRRKLPRGVWGHAPPENFEIYMLGNAIFNVFQTVIGPKLVIKIKTILPTIFYVNYDHSCAQNLNHWLLEKSEMTNLQMLIQKNTFDVLSSRCPFKETCSAMSVSVF